MGCDGGTIPRRDELVRTKKKPEQKDKDAEREFRWLHCTLSQQRLQEPIVMCGLGRLYSKQNVIEQLLEKDKMPESVKHIKSMKDIKTLNLTPNPAYIDEDKSEGLLDTRHAPYICKLIGLEMSGKFRFVALWNCACVMSERALKEIKSSIGVCPQCQTPYAVEDVVLLNASSDEDLELMQVKMQMRNAKRKATKKDKKNKTEKVAINGQVITNEATVEDVVIEDEPCCSKTATKTKAKAQITKTQTENSAKLKMSALSKRPNNADTMQDPDMKRLKNDFTVAHDPKASDVYKSLFTTHKSEQEQTRAHWVTYNPFYN